MSQRQDYTLIRTNWAGIETEHELELEYETYRAEPDVGIMSDGVECVCAWEIVDGKRVAFELTDDETDMARYEIERSM